MTRELVWRRVIQQAPRFEPRDAEALTARIRAAIATAPISSRPIESRPIGSGPIESESIGSESQRQTPVAPALRAVDIAPARRPWRAPASAVWLVAGVAASILCVSLTAWIWLTILRSGATTAPDLVAHEIVSSHIRSLMAQHLTDVPSSDRHTVKPWFAGKVPYALTVPDFQAEGFALEGGRLDYVNGRTVAALVYRRRLHVINVFVWPLTPGDRQTTDTHTEAGYGAIAWTARGQQLWAVSDVSDADLRQFVGLFQREE